MYKAIIFAAISMILFSCSTMKGPFVKKKVGVSPEINKVSQVYVGEKFYSQFDYMVTDTIKIVGKFDFKFIDSGRVKINDGEVFFRYSDEDGSNFYCSVNGNFFWGNNKGSIICVRDINNDGLIDDMNTPKSFFTNPWYSVSDKKIFYKKQAIIKVGSGVRTDLIYQGRSNNVIKVQYREYVNNFVRPLFDQNLTYTLDETQTKINFKGAEIEIMEADNNSIKYRILKKIRGFGS
ncbi:MAG: hypothetical protein GY730_07700 [bacterium]|nr:hypothetical protein [bacterium]